MGLLWLNFKFLVSLTQLFVKVMEPKIKSVSVKEETYCNVKVPKWPYEKWKLSENSQGNASMAIGKTAAPAHSIPASVSPVFCSFLQGFSHQLGIDNNQTSTELLGEIKTMLNNSLDELGKSYKCFENCQLVQAGSTAEKTKIEAPDEFDFLIVMEYFANKEYFQTVVKKDVVRIYVKHPTVMEFLPFTSYEHNPGPVDFIEVTLRSKFMELFIEIFDSVVPPDWKRVTAEDKIPCGSGIASTLHLSNEKFQLDIDVDLCLCLPISTEDFQHAMFVPEGLDPLFADYFESQMLLFRFINYVMEQSPLELFAIFGRSDGFHEAISTRITAPKLELSHFQSYPPGDGRIKAYCLAKCILSAYLPKLGKIFGCKRCCHKLVRSYHIKNILLFMLKNYKEDVHWTEDNLPQRVLEIFSILKQCMITDVELSYDAAISKFCFPGSLYVDNVTNLSPYYDSDGGHNFFFTPDSHKPMYQLSSSPVYKDCLSTGNEEADRLLKAWFEKLNRKPWNSRQLLSDLFNLLKTLNEINS